MDNKGPLPLAEIPAPKGGEYQARYPVAGRFEQEHKLMNVGQPPMFERDVYLWSYL
jgi:hypothetical protein